MILWAKAESVGTPNDQRVKLIGIVGGNLRVKLCGTGEEAIISPLETCGVEFAEGNYVLYSPTKCHRIRVLRQRDPQ